MLSCVLSRREGCVTVLICFMLLITFIGRALAKSNPQTTLTRKLFRGYEKLPPPGGPTVVSLGIYINYFYAMSEQSMDYRLSFYMRQAWFDSRFVFNSSEHGNIKRLKLDDSDFPRIWIPDVFFRNEKGAAFHQVTQNNRLFYVSEDGKLWYVSKISATFSCPMKLQKYPLDRQSCPIRFESFGYTTDTIVYQWLEEKSIEYDDLARELPEMVIEDEKRSDCTFNDTSEYQPGQYSCLEVQFVATRPLGYFMIQFYIPSILLVILSWVSFWISVDAVVARVSIGLLTVLNLVTQSTGSRNQLPKVSYVKAIDVWMTACLVFAFASLIEFAIVNVWSRTEARQKKQQAKDGAAVTAAAATGGGAGAGGGGGAAAAAMASLSSSTATGVQSSGATSSGTGGGGTAGGGGGGRVGGMPKSQPQDKHASELSTPQLQVSLQVSDQTVVGVGGRRTRRLSDLSNIISQPLLSIHQHRAQTLDQLARKLFPGSFLLFNIMYWVVYTQLND